MNIDFAVSKKAGKTITFKEKSIDIYQKNQK